LRLLKGMAVVTSLMKVVTERLNRLIGSFVWSCVEFLVERSDAKFFSRLGVK